MVETTIIGLDVAKQIFQVHGVSAHGMVTVKRQLRRSDVLGFFGRLGRCIVGLEACGGPTDPTGLCEAVRQARQDGRS